MKQTNIINFTLVLFLGFLFISCTGAQKKLKSQDIPSWFLSSPAQDKNNLYGTSSAYSLEQAKKQALNNISSYLSIEIQSSTKIQKNSGNGYYNHNISQNISTNTKKLQFTNTEIIKDTIINSKHYVLVQVNKNKLFDENKNILLNSDKHINNKMKENKNSSLLEKIKNISSLEKELRESLNKAYILYAINNDFQYKKYVSKYKNILNKKETLISKIIVNVENKSINKDSKHFSNSLINFFNNNNYNVSKYNFNVISKIYTQFNYSKYKDWFITKTITNIKIYTNNKIISSSLITSIGRSSSSQENANISASNNFKKELNKINISNILFSK